MPNECAVLDCPNEGRPQVCMYDGRFHHHGRIHYDCQRADTTEHGLAFRPNGWRLICDEHYATLVAAQFLTEEVARA